MQKKTGFTMIESLIAVGVILFGLLSLVSLGASSLISGRITSEQFVAANLAREGMEAIRQVRDSNWLEYDTDSTTVWNEGMYDEPMAGIYDFSGVVESLYSSPFQLDFYPDAFGDTQFGIAGDYDTTAIWLDTTDEKYFQTTATVFDHTDTRYQQTPFSRLFYTYPICRDLNNQADEQVISSEGAVDCDGLDDPMAMPAKDFEQVGIDAIVQVQWPAQNSTANYTIEEHIYDWRY